MKNLFPALSKTAILFLLANGFSFHAGAQLHQAETSLNQAAPSPAMLKHYSVSDLDAIAASDSLKYSSIFYYYKHSFVLETIDCNDCVPFETGSFDVSKYEEYRKRSERYTLTFHKYGFKVTLLSIDELEYKLPIHH